MFFSSSSSWGGRESIFNSFLNFSNRFPIWESKLLKFESTAHKNSLSSGLDFFFFFFLQVMAVGEIVFYCHSFFCHLLAPILYGH